jgi:hypothetical protein
VFFSSLQNLQVQNLQGLQGFQAINGLQGIQAITPQGQIISGAALQNLGAVALSSGGTLQGLTATPIQQVWLDWRMRHCLKLCVCVKLESMR